MHLLHSLRGTHLLAFSSRTVPPGHWQPGTHCLVQKSGKGTSHVGGQAVPHSWNICPSIEQDTGCGSAVVYDGALMFNAAIVNFAVHSSIFNLLGQIGQHLPLIRIGSGQ